MGNPPADAGGFFFVCNENVCAPSHGLAENVKFVGFQKNRSNFANFANFLIEREAFLPTRAKKMNRDPRSEIRFSILVNLMFEFNFEVFIWRFTTNL